MSAADAHDETAYLRWVDTLLRRADDGPCWDVQNAPPNTEAIYLQALEEIIDPDTWQDDDGTCRWCREKPRAAGGVLHWVDCAADIATHALVEIWERLSPQQRAALGISREDDAPVVAGTKA